MDVPVDFGAGVQLGVDGWEEAGGDVRGDGDVDELVEGECDEDFVDVKGERREAECGGDGAGEGGEEGGRREEWVEHGGGCEIGG